MFLFSYMGIFNIDGPNFAQNEHVSKVHEYCLDSGSVQSELHIKYLFFMTKINVALIRKGKLCTLTTALSNCFLILVHRIHVKFFPGLEEIIKDMGGGSTSNLVWL